MLMQLYQVHGPCITMAFICQLCMDPYWVAGENEILATQCGR